MKIKVLLSILILVLAVSVIVGSGAKDKKTYIAKEDEELFGAWINPDYDEAYEGGKIIYQPDGIKQGFSTAAITKEWWNNKFTITDKWIDDEGTIWYKWLRTDIRGRVLKSHSDYYYFGKISESGKVFEFSYSGSDYPPEINPDNLRYNYRIYYRQ